MSGISTRWIVARSQRSESGASGGLSESRRPPVRTRGSSGTLQRRSVRENTLRCWPPVPLQLKMHAARVCRAQARPARRHKGISGTVRHTRSKQASSHTSATPALHAQQVELCVFVGSLDAQHLAMVGVVDDPWPCSSGGHAPKTT